MTYLLAFVTKVNIRQKNVNNLYKNLFINIRGNLYDWEIREICCCRHKICS